MKVLVHFINKKCFDIPGAQTNFTYLRISVFLYMCRKKEIARDETVQKIHFNLEKIL